MTAASRIEWSHQPGDWRSLASGGWLLRDLPCLVHPSPCSTLAARRQGSVLADGGSEALVTGERSGGADGAWDQWDRRGACAAGDGDWSECCDRSDRRKWCINVELAKMNEDAAPYFVASSLAIIAISIIFVGYAKTRSDNSSNDHKAYFAAVLSLFLLVAFFFIDGHGNIQFGITSPIGLLLVLIFRFPLFASGAIASMVFMYKGRPVSSRLTVIVLALMLLNIVWLYLSLL